MSLNFNTLGALILAGSIASSIPAMANDNRREPSDRGPAVLETYSGSEGTEPYVQVPVSVEEAPAKIMIDRGRRAN